MRNRCVDRLTEFNLTEMCSSYRSVLVQKSQVKVSMSVLSILLTYRILKTLEDFKTLHTLPIYLFTI